MSALDTLPVILVSAINEIAAAELVSELIDNDVTENYMKDTQSVDRVWRLVNKYYTVNVRVHTLTDHGQLKVDPNTIEAHIIHITEDELSDEKLALARAEARAAGAGDSWRRAGVRLLLSSGARAGVALGAWAAGQRAEAVALRAAPGALGPFAEPGGLGAARAALHAHVWRGLVRTDRAAPPPPSTAGHALSDASAGSSCSDDSACSDSSDSESEERRAVEQAEAFAAALGALGPALAARPGPGAHAAPADRDQAEALVLAFCRALGLDPDAC